jgi:sulfite exporter TauE/SafE
MLFGLLAGFSTCAALVGGIILTFARRGIAHVISFNLGRLVFFTILGGLLGYFGSFFRLSITTSAIVTIIVSLVMAVVALQMLGLKIANKFSLALPKSLTGKIVSSQQSSFFIGGLTFFLPCGFTLTAQSLALASSSWLTGGLIMMFFALGTLIPLTIIGITGAKSQSNPVTAKYFSQVAGILVLAFAIFNLSSQFTVLGVSAPSPVQSQTNNSDLVPIVNNKQLIKMDASSTGYTPNTFTIKAGQPTRMEITDKGTSGCTNAVIARSLFDGVINLVPGTTSTKEFTAPTTLGRYRFSCWMGMISGTIEVVE